MGQFNISAGRVGRLRKKVAAAGGAAGTLDNGPETLQLQWLARDKKTALGDAIELEAGADKLPVEAFHPSGAIRNMMIPVGLEFGGDAPQGAEYLHVSQGGESSTYSLESVTAQEADDPEQEQRFTSPTARFVFPVFAERFTDPAPFFAAVKALHTYIIGRAPFNEPGMDSIFALRGYYWRTDPRVGRFDTKDKGYNCVEARSKPAMTFSGSNADARAALGPYMWEGKYGLVLINSDIRGGAGGQADQGNPAWASIKSCSGEDWEAVALHEIGHALGLADEYLDSNLKKQSRNKEPNCAGSTGAGDVPWHGHYSPGMAGSHVYSIPEQSELGKPGQRPVPKADFVGLFQGARYRDDYYRPSINCLMRYTNCDYFCPICVDAIRAKLLHV